MRFKRVMSGVLAVLIALPNVMQLAASPDEGEKFQYTMFGRNGITMSVSSNLCMNGNLHTNKDAAITATNKNINGKVTTSTDIEKRVKHVYADQKIYDTYFTTNCELHEEEYVYSDMNIHINNPLYCYSNITLNGNVSLNSSLGSLMNINVTGEVKNANNSVVYSKYGNITIENDSTANVNGLIYAPLGTVTINSPNVTINGIIIADQVVINGSSVNVNCNDNIARFIGETSEEYDFSDLEYLPEDWFGDTDADALFDIYEKVIDSDPFNPDTDGDGLPDGYEVLTLNTDPLEIDTDGNGVLDRNEDFDTDNLVNIDEYLYQTLPFTPDTDEDGFFDGDEVHIYGTNPTIPDTDGDKLLDGEESYDGSIYLEYGVYFDPLNPDTDGDGISDGDEVFGQTKVQDVQTQDEAITEVVVDMDINGNIDRNLTVESMNGIDAMTSNVYALVGEPFNFETESDFESATITFKIDQSKLGDTQFDNLVILRYNEAEKTFVEMDTAHDAANSTVSTTTTHFSQYMVVDSVKWFENWDDSIAKLRKMWSSGSTSYKKLNTIFLVDSSAEIAQIDKYYYSLRIGFNGVTEENLTDIAQQIDHGADIRSLGAKLCDRITICESIIDHISSADTGRVIIFSDSVEYDSRSQNNHQLLKEAVQKIDDDGGTAYLDTALDYACSFIDGNSSDLYRIVVITSSAVNFGRISADDFSSNTALNIVNLGSSAIGRNIDAVAQATGGDVYNAITADDLTSQHGETIYTPPQFIGVDSDGDTIPDIVEECGLKPNGEPIGTNPNLKDSDGDGIEDQIELGYMNINQIVYTPQGYLEYLTYTSDPAKVDTDGDGILDNEELNFGFDLYSDPLSTDSDSDGIGDFSDPQPVLEYKAKDVNWDLWSSINATEYMSKRNITELIFKGIHEVALGNYHTSVIVFASSESEYYYNNEFSQNGDTWSENWNNIHYVTMGAGPKIPIAGDPLTSGYNREKDVMLDIKVQMVNLTISNIVNDSIPKLLACHEYFNSLEEEMRPSYDLFPMFDSQQNSNSYAVGLLNASGIDDLRMPEYNVPGYFFPLASSYFGIDMEGEEG